MRDLVVRYGSGRKARRATPAVDGVSFDLAAGETLGIVGESGSGKSTIGKAVLGLQKPTSGIVRLHGQDITTMSLTQRRTVAADLRVVFQDPYSSLNPARTIGQTLVEPLRLLGVGEAEADKRARESLVSVGLPGEAVERYPSQFSGGQRQRDRHRPGAGLPTRRSSSSTSRSVALDLSSQAQVLNLLADLREQHNLAFLFIAHDLGVVRFLSQRAVVLYRGQVMESGPVESITQQPRHPYTMALTAAAPVPRPAEQAARRAAREALGVGMAGAAKPSPTGCPFVPRCPLATELCCVERPPLRLVDGNLTACHHAEKVPALQQP